jgi:hypothetical protein
MSYQFHLQTRRPRSDGTGNAIRMSGIFETALPYAAGSEFEYGGVRYVVSAVRRGALGITIVDCARFGVSAEGTSSEPDAEREAAAASRVSSWRRFRCRVVDGSEHADRVRSIPR